MALVLIPPGDFTMGNGHTPDEEVGLFEGRYGMSSLASRFDDEYPPHRVRITAPFYLGARHVTVGQFRRFVQRTGYKTDAERDGKGGVGFTGNALEQRPVYSRRNPGFEQADDRPVVNVSWNDAVAFCRWLDREDGREYRLPSEAEWEYACRAGTTGRYWCGDDPEELARVANVADAALAAKFPPSKSGLKASDGYAFTSPAGSYRPNPFGLFDMHGNAQQWCADWYDVAYYEGCPKTDPTGPPFAGLRVLRGGSWLDTPMEARRRAPRLRARLPALFCRLPRGLDGERARDDASELAADQSGPPTVPVGNPGNAPTRPATARSPTRSI